MKNTFQRKLSVEFLDNIDLIKQKTSRAKKTLRSMITFMNERINIETKYAISLQNLAKTGGVSNMVSNMQISHSIIDYKNYEEQSMRDAINSLINYTIQESELHREFSVQTKTNIVEALMETRKNLSYNKKGWLQKLDQLKKQIKEANEAYKREYLKLQQQHAIVEDLKRKRDEQYRRCGLSLDEQLQFENMPKLIQQAEQKYQEAILKYNEIKKSNSLQQEYTEKCVADFNKGSSDILDQIEKQEYQRLEVLKQCLNSFAVTLVNMVNQSESLHKLIEMEFNNADPVKDIQLFIQRNSTFADNERLKNLYKEMGLYQPLNEEAQPIPDKVKMMGGGLLVEKTSRAMAIQLKQMEEDRKRKAEEDEQHKKEQQKMKEIQSLVDQLKNSRELLYKLGNQGLTTNNLELLILPQQQQSSVSESSSANEFKIHSKSVFNELIYLLLNLQKPIQLTGIKQKLRLNDEKTAYLDLHVKNLREHKCAELLSVVWRILDYYKSKMSDHAESTQLDLQGPEREFYLSLMGFAWTWIRLIILRHSQFNLELYEKDFNQFVDQVEMAHHSEQQLTSEALEFTFNGLKYIQKISKKESVALSFPLNYMLFQNVIPLYLDDKGANPKSFLVTNFNDLFNCLSDFTFNFIGVKQAFQLLHMMKYLYSEVLSKETFAQFDDQQNKGLYSLKTLMAKLNKEYPKALKQKLISLELIREKQLTAPLDYFSMANHEPAKILFRLSNSWLMSDLCVEILKTLSNYEVIFGECSNKLRLILDFQSICYRLSFIFVSDGTLQSKIKVEVLTKAGDRAAMQICQNQGFEPPFILQRKPSGQMGSKTNILDVVRCFTEILKNEEENFKKVWDQHIASDALKPSDQLALERKQSIRWEKQKYYDSSLYYYSQKMAQILEDDIKSKLDDLDFDKDPYQIVGELITCLQEFDKVSRRKTLNVIRPKMEQWIQMKLVNIREVVSRGITFETWDPISNTQLYSESVVNVFYTLNETLENLYDFVGQEIFLRWSKCIQVMIHDVIFEYSEWLLKGLDNLSQYKPPDVLPPLNLQARSKQWFLSELNHMPIEGKKNATYTVHKKSPLQEFTPAMFNQLAGMGSKNWVDFAAANDQSTSLGKLLTRLANIDFIHDQLHHMKIRFFSLSNPNVLGFDQNELFKAAYELISETSKSVIYYIANKMVYIDFNDIIFANLYIGRSQEMVTMRPQLQALNNYMRTVFMKTTKKYFKETLNVIHQTLIDALLRYLMLLSSLGFQLGVQCDDFFKNPIILQSDIRELIVFFSPKDRDGNDIGLTKQECEANSEVIFRFLQYMREDDQMLIALFKSIDQDVSRNKEIISRILYRRGTKDVDKFFEDYKTLFGK